MSSLYFAKNGFGDTKIGELAKIIRKGQKEGSVIRGDALYLADLYWRTGFVKECAAMEDIDEVWAIGRNKNKLESLKSISPKIVTIEADLIPK